MKALFLLFVSVLFADTSVTKVPSGASPTPAALPCAEGSSKGDEKCVVKPAPVAEAEPKLELPTPSKPNKTAKETPRKNKK